MRLIQNARRDQDLVVTDRVAVEITEASEAVAAAVGEWREYVAEQVLAASIAGAGLATAGDGAGAGSDDGAGGEGGASDDGASGAVAHDAKLDGPFRFTSAASDPPRRGRKREGGPPRPSGPPSAAGSDRSRVPSKGLRRQFFQLGGYNHTRVITSVICFLPCQMRDERGRLLVTITESRLAAVDETDQATEVATKMRVRKRNGALEPVNLNKIVNAVARAAEGLLGVDPMVVSTRTISALSDGSTTRELDELSIRTAAGLIVEEPNYSKLAARMLSVYIDKEVRNQNVPWFSESVARGAPTGADRRRHRRLRRGPRPRPQRGHRLGPGPQLRVLRPAHRV